MIEEPKRMPSDFIAKNTCYTCWHDADNCGCPQPKLVLNPSNGVSYRFIYTVSKPLKHKFRRLLDESVV